MGAMPLGFFLPSTCSDAFSPQFNLILTHLMPTGALFHNGDPIWLQWKDFSVLVTIQGIFHVCDVMFCLYKNDSGIKA